MRWVSTLAIGLACAACQPYPNRQHIATLPDQPQPSGQSQPGCRDFTAPVTAAGKPEQSSGQACQQPDGSWRVVQNTPGLPAQTYLTPPPVRTTAAGTHPANKHQPAAAAQLHSQPPTSRSCSRYTAAVTVGGQPQQAVIGVSATRRELEDHAVRAGLAAAGLRDPAAGLLTPTHGF
jgi:surface antigen